MLLGLPTTGQSFVAALVAPTALHGGSLLLTYSRLVVSHSSSHAGIFLAKLAVELWHSKFVPLLLRQPSLFHPDSQLVHFLQRPVGLIQPCFPLVPF